MMQYKRSDRSMLVYAHWEGMSEPVFMGILQSALTRGKEVFSFEYDDNWLNSEFAMHLDPDLGLYKGQHYLTDDRSNFGLFLDSSPDRWGRILMRRREAAMARKEKRKEQHLFETDFLLGVYDGHRMGALRFKLEKDGPFLNDNKEMASPPWTSIRTLQEISLRLEEDDVVNDPDYLKWLNMLVAPGSSLGGARPKASVVDPDGRLWIAKFPSQSDNFNVGAWEMLVHELALKAGINMSECKVKKFSGKHHTFLTKRFDRTDGGERIHFASAMTLLGRKDGQNYEDGISYLDLAEFISEHGAKVGEDLEELWRRMVFSICISNADDHLRNHGFLLTPNGWRLSPAFDINPIETATGLSLNINEHENALDINLAMEVYAYFRLNEKRAMTIVREVKKVVRNWSNNAGKLKISKAEQELKALAFAQAEN